MKVEQTINKKYRARAFYLGRKMFWYGTKIGLLFGIVIGIIVMWIFDK